MQHQPLETAAIEWRDQQTPVSSRYHDVYFSADDGCAESRHVFLDSNRLAQRFAALAGTHFTVAETGFGTGLNFLQCWQLWRQHRKPGQKLYFISAELHPLSLADLRHSHSHWPQLASLSDQLCAAYPLPISGQHALELADGITLILLFADASDGFADLLENPHPGLTCERTRAVDAWFLDGFAPGKNETLWQDRLFKLMARLSKPGSTFATFTAAGHVRRGLMANGFAVNKSRGFGRKRDMLTGEYRGLPNSSLAETHSTRHRAMPFWPVCRNQRHYRSVIVIGAGIAGCTTATTLADAGMDVLLLDQQATPMQQASGNPQAVLFPKLSLGSDAFASFNLLSLLYAWRYYRRDGLNTALNACGLLQLASPDQQDKMQRLARHWAALPELLQAVSAAEASALANTRLAHGGLYYPQSGWLDTAHLRDFFCDALQTRFIGNCRVSQLQHTGDGWQVNSNTGGYQADALVLCNAQAASELLAPWLTVPTRTIRGQITRLAQADQQLHTVVCHDGYICPPRNNQPYTLGASFDLGDSNPALSQASQTHNLALLQQYLPDFDIDNAPLDGRVGFRCSAPDYLPLIGPVPDQSAFQRDYAALRHNARTVIPQTGRYMDGLFVNIGYGSRGFSSAPVGAAVLRAWLLGQMWPMPSQLIQAVNPARFVIRGIERS